jgi:hypothetical protein
MPQPASYIQHAQSTCIQLINYLFQQMHYTILVFSCPYMYFGTYSAIFMGVVESS